MSYTSNEWNGPDLQVGWDCSKISHEDVAAYNLEHHYKKGR